MKTTFVEEPSTFIVPLGNDNTWHTTTTTYKLIMLDAKDQEDETLTMAVVEPLFTGFRVFYWHTDSDEEEPEEIVFGTWEEAEEFMIAHSVALRMS